MNINNSDVSKILGMARSTIYAMQDREELPGEIKATDIMYYLQRREDEIKAIKNRLGQYMIDEPISE